MSLTLGDIQLNTGIKVRPISIVDTLGTEEIQNNKKQSLFSKIYSYFFKRSDLSYNEWEKLESKKQFLAHLDNFDIHRGGGL